MIHPAAPACTPNSLSLGSFRGCVRTPRSVFVAQIRNLEFGLMVTGPSVRGTAFGVAVRDHKRRNARLQRKTPLERDHSRPLACLAARRRRLGRALAWHVTINTPASPHSSLLELTAFPGLHSARRRADAADHARALARLGFELQVRRGIDVRPDLAADGSLALIAQRHHVIVTVAVVARFGTDLGAAQFIGAVIGCGLGISRGGNDNEQPAARQCRNSRHTLRHGGSLPRAQPRASGRPRAGRASRAARQRVRTLG